MPIVVCPGCGAKLNAPDAAVGKRVKCPRANCGTAVPVPAVVAAAAEELSAEPPPAPSPPPPQSKQSASFDFDDDEPKQSKKPARKAKSDEDEDEDRPAKKKRASDEDEEETTRPAKKKRRPVDDDDDDDDRPSRRRKQPASGLTPVVIGAIALVGLLVLGGVGYGIYALTKKKDEVAGSGGSGGSGSSTPEKPKGKVPEKWVEYKSDQDRFKMTMPAQVQKKRAPNGKGNQYQAVDVSTFLVTLVHTIETPPGTSPENRKELEDGVFEGLVGKNSKADRRQVLFKGKMVEEITMDVPTKERKDGLDFKPRMIVRVVHGEARIYLVCVMAMQSPDQLKDAEAIFDTFQIN